MPRPRPSIEATTDELVTMDTVNEPVAVVRAIAIALATVLTFASAGLAAALGTQAIPIERVVPDLCSVVEHRRIRRAVRSLDNQFERLAVVVGAGDGCVELVDVGLVVLAVVKVDGFFGNVRLQRIARIG